jgi:hypothetical protein
MPDGVRRSNGGPTQQSRCREETRERLRLRLFLLSGNAQADADQLDRRKDDCE